jgi:hypothetical protein
MDNRSSWTDIGVIRSKNFQISRMSVHEITGKVSSLGKEVKKLNRIIKTKDDMIKHLQLIINDLQTQLEQNIHDEEIQHLADDNTKEDISDLFKSLEAREPGSSIDKILKEVLTQEVLVRTSNL